MKGLSAGLRRAGSLVLLALRWLARTILAFFRARRQSGLHWLIFVVHVGFAVGVAIRPYLPYIINSYSAFDSTLPWDVWGWLAGGIALLLLVLRPGTLWAQGAHLLSSMYFLLVAAVFVQGSGVTSAYFTYTALAGGALALFARNFRAWLPHARLVQHLVEHPPRWARRRDH